MNLLSAILDKLYVMTDPLLVDPRELLEEIVRVGPRAIEYILTQLFCLDLQGVRDSFYILLSFLNPNFRNNLQEYLYDDLVQPEAASPAQPDRQGA